ncbi:hypothetical protein MSG28_002193 [Choristoneura fumiferana]|uniref:Uncharacterized protein n=1 Tax=Choristoneura fumiferana TaxID=7141 RepID=A0ACC0JU96_CHOFU|nr:hypothetical protein MSG28_002193 [Choristoneura fumiferana]
MDTRAAKLALARKKLKDHQVKKGVLKEGNGNEYREDDAQNTKDSHICENPIVTDASIRPDDDNIVKQTINLTDQNQNYNNCQPLSPEVNVTELLVSSKRNLELTVNQLQLKLSQAESDYSAALNSHNLSKKQLSSLEKNLKNINDKYMIMAEEVQSKDRVIENLHAQKSSLLDENSNLQDQLEFTKTVLTAKETENDSLHSQLYKLQEQLDATQLHLQQITNGSADCITPSNGTQDGHLTVALQQKILALEQQIKVLQKERDQISSHYEHYVGDLNNQLKSALVKNEELVREVQDLTNREMGLIEQISDMEIRLQNYQKFKESVDSKALANDNINELQHSHAQTMDMLKELSNKYEKLQKEFTDSEAKVRELSQSQDKLELVEKITAEKYLNRELTIKLAEIEEKAKDMNIKLKAKDEEMIRLQTNSREIEKQLELLSKESTFVEDAWFVKNSEGKVKCSELRTKDKKELFKQLEELKTELTHLRVSKVTGGAASKLSKIRVVRKAIARVYIVYHQKMKVNLRNHYKNKKYKPLDLRPKKTRAMRKALTPHEAKLKTRKEIRKKSLFPPRRLWGVSLVQLIALLYKDQHATTLHKLLNVWVETGLSDSSEDNESNTTPPNRRSEDSSPMLTSDPTSDSSDTGASGKNNEEPNSENNGWGAFSENNTSENGSPPCQQPVENDSDITMRDKNENETLKSDENKTAKDDPNMMNSQPAVSNKEQQSSKKEKENFKSGNSDSGHGTQLENQESISTSSNDEGTDSKKPVHQKPHNPKQVANNKIPTAITLQDRKRKKLVKRAKANIINVQGLAHKTPSDDDIANVIKEFTVDFLLKGYNSLIRTLHSQILTNIKLEIDTSHFFWLLTYFLKLAAQIELDLELISSALSFEMVSYLTAEGVNLCEQFELALKLDGNDLKPSIRRLHLVITAIREFVQAIDAYKKFPHLNPQDHEKLDTLRTKMCELDELRSLLVLLLRTYNPKYHSKAYLQDLIVTNHLLLLFLDIGMRSPDGDYSLMTEHIQQFASPEIMYQYALLLEDYMENGEWTENDLSSLSWHYMQCNTQQDVVGEIVICYKEDGSTKTRDSVIKALYKQNIINKEEFDKLSKKETDRCSKMKKINKEIRDVEIGKLCEQLRQDGKYKCFEWVQTVLLKACHVKLYFEKKTLRCAEDNLTKVEGSNILQFKFFNQEIQELPVLSPVSYHSLPKLKFSMDDLANVGAYPVQHCASVHPLENYYQIHKQRHLATMLTFIPIAPVEPIVLTEDILGDNVAVKAELREEVDEPLLPPNEDNFDADLSDFDDDDSVCDTASVVSDLTRMYVSDEDEKSQLPPRPRGKMHSHSPMGLFTEIPMT